MLEIKGLTKNFGGLTAVDRVDLSINQGELVGLIGPNGAGKSTVFNLVTGFIRPSSGTIVFEGENVAGKSPHHITDKGMVRTFQATEVFPQFTVLENVLAATHLRPRISFWEDMFNTPGGRRKKAQTLNRAKEIVQFVGLGGAKDELASRLPHGHKRILGIAIALAAEPKLLLLDEPLTGMHAGEVDEAVELITKIWKDGTTVLIIEHNMRAAMKLCPRLAVINFGRKLTEGTPEEIQANEQVIQAYLGVGKHAA